MQVDISKVYEIVQDFQNKRIEIKSKEGFCLWQQVYTNEEAFNKAFREMSKKLSEELIRREGMKK